MPKSTLGRWLTGSGRGDCLSGLRMEHLGVRPGAVTPLAMITGAKMGVAMFLDPALKTCCEIYMHPLVNDRTIGMAPGDLGAFLDSVGAEWRWLEGAPDIGE